MGFQEQYLDAMWERAPKMLMELRRTGQLKEHLKQKRLDAHVLLRQILARMANPSAAAEGRAQEEVLAILTEFSPEEGALSSETEDDRICVYEIPHDDDFPLWESDCREIGRIAELIRSYLCTMTPADLRSIAPLLLALQRLPLATPGVAASISFRQWYSEGNHAWLNLYINDYELQLGIGQHFYDSDVSGDTETDTLFEAVTGAEQSKGSIEAWLSKIDELRQEGGPLSLCIGDDDSDYADMDWREYAEAEIRTSSLIAARRARVAPPIPGR